LLLNPISSTSYLPPLQRIEVVQLAGGEKESFLIGLQHTGESIVRLSDPLSHLLDARDCPFGVALLRV
jgi:hypothetical protein